MHENGVQDNTPQAVFFKLMILAFFLLAVNSVDSTLENYDKRN